jgi:tetratricopeptide (TPR) repeat protein
LNSFVVYCIFFPDAAQFLQLIAFMHHEGISEDIFGRASTKAATQDCMLPCTDETSGTGATLDDLLAGFRTTSRAWYRPAFLNMINDVRSYSLLDFDSASGTYSIHPLVQSWLGITVSDTQTAPKRTATLLSLAVFNSHDYVSRTMLVPHIEALPPDWKREPNCAREFALAYNEAGYWQVAEALQVMVVQADKRTLGDEHMTTLADMHQLGMTYQKTGRFEEAEATQTQVVASRTRLLGDSHVETTRALAYLSVTYHWKCRYNEAEILQVKIIEAAKRLHGAEEHETLLSMHALASTYLSQGRLNESRELLVEVTEIEERTLGANHPTTLMSMSNLSLLLLDQIESAETLAAKALESYRAQFGKNHPDTLSGMNLLTAIYHQQGRIQEASKLYFEALELQQQALGDKHVQTLTTMGNLACTYYLPLGRLSEAEVLQQRVLEHCAPQLYGLSVVLQMLPNRRSLSTECPTPQTGSHRFSVENSRLFGNIRCFTENP